MSKAGLLCMALPSCRVFIAGPLATALLLNALLLCIWVAAELLSDEVLSRGLSVHGHEWAGHFELLSPCRSGLLETALAVVMSSRQSPNLRAYACRQHEARVKLLHHHRYCVRLCLSICMPQATQHLARSVSHTNFQTLINAHFLSAKRTAMRDQAKEQELGCHDSHCYRDQIAMM